MRRTKSAGAAKDGANGSRLPGVLLAGAASAVQWDHLLSADACFTDGTLLPAGTRLQPLRTGKSIRSRAARAVFYRSFAEIKTRNVTLARPVCGSRIARVTPQLQPIAALVPLHTDFMLRSDFGNELNS